MTISELGSCYFRIEGQIKGCTLLWTKGGGGGIFFDNTPDMQYFKGRLYPAFSVPLKGESARYHP